MKKVKIIAIILVSIVILSMDEKVDAMVEVSGNWYSLGKDNVCESSGGYTACYEPKFEFRVTLVKNTGEKVNGTKSVEYGYSQDKSTRKVDFTNEQKNMFVNPNSFKYKYSDEFNDYNQISTHTYYQINMVNNPKNYTKYVRGKDRDDPDKYKSFTDEFKQNITSNRFGIDPGTTGSYDFITMFLYHCGFLQKTDGNYYNLIDAKNATKLVEISKNDYYILIEPLYTIFYNETPSGRLTYNYGTASEIGELLYNKTTSESKMQSGYMAGLSLIFTYNAGSNLYTQPDEIVKNFRASRLKSINIEELEKYNTNNPTPPLDVRFNRREKWAELANLDYGYGVSILRIKEKYHLDEKINYNALLDLCGKEKTTQANDGVISFSTSFATEKNILDFFPYEENKFEKSADANNKIYCYDEFIYDFSNTLKRLNSNTGLSFKPSTQVEIKPGKLTVNRYCYIKEWKNYETSFTENFSMYTSKKIPLNLFKDKIYLEPSSAQIVKQKNNGVESNYKFIKMPALNRGPAIIEITAEVDFSYNKNSSLYAIPSSIEINKDYNSSVDLTNVSYGYSTKLINELSKNPISFSKYYMDEQRIFNIVLDYTDYQGNANDKICSVVSKTDGDIPGEEQIKFRTIALDNPFPARDATTRMPGSNWLGKNNYVRGYITYNRGVTGEEVYDKNPIYTIKLTPDTMIKIREYNKKHNYADINLNCSGENNTECMSEFLRDTSIFKSESVTGSCMITSNTYKDITNGVSPEQLRQKMASITDTFKQEGTYDSRYDFNHDKRINNNDAKIFTYAEKTTPYYTCADKTFENSGYLGRSED